MYNGNADGGDGTGYHVQPHVALDPPEEQYPDRDDYAYTGGLAAQDINAQRYTQQYAVNIPDDDQLTYGEGRTYQHSSSFADYPPHTLVSSIHAVHAVATPTQTTLFIARVTHQEHFLHRCINKSGPAVVSSDEQLASIQPSNTTVYSLTSLRCIRAAKHAPHLCQVITAQEHFQLLCCI